METTTTSGLRFERVADGANREPRYVVPVSAFNKREELDYWAREDAYRLAKWRAGRFRFTPYKGKGEYHEHFVGTAINLEGLAELIRKETGR